MCQLPRSAAKQKPASTGHQHAPAASFPAASRCGQGRRAGPAPRARSARNPKRPARCPQAERTRAEGEQRHWRRSARRRPACGFPGGVGHDSFAWGRGRCMAPLYASARCCQVAKGNASCQPCSIRSGSARPRRPTGVLMAPLTRGCFVARACAAADHDEHYAQRAAAGLIITEATGIWRQGQGWPYAPEPGTDEPTEALEAE